MTKAADIMAAATPGPWGIEQVVEAKDDWWAVTGGVDNVAFTGEADARAIVTAVNLFPLYEAVREAATEMHGDCRICAALDALQAAEDAL